jgi:hypothetical protein
MTFVKERSQCYAPFYLKYDKNILKQVDNKTLDLQLIYTI